MAHPANVYVSSETKHSCLCSGYHEPALRKTTNSLTTTSPGDVCEKVFMPSTSLTFEPNSSLASTWLVFTCQTGLWQETSGSCHSLAVRTVKLAADTLKSVLSNCPVAAVVLVHSQPEHMIVGRDYYPSADCTRVRFDAQVLVCASLLLLCRLPSEVAACIRLTDQYMQPAASAQPLV